MSIPIESPDIRSVYLMEISGQRSDRLVKLDPRIVRIKRKLIDASRAKTALLGSANRKQNVSSL